MKLILLMILIGIGLIAATAGCAHTSAPPPPPPPSYSTIVFGWTPPELPSLPDCTGQTAEPCLRYDLTDQASGVVVGHPPITDKAFTLKPAPTSWPHSYMLALGIVSNDGSFTPCLHPALTVVSLP